MTFCDFCCRHTQLCMIVVLLLRENDVECLTTAKSVALLPQSLRHAQH